MRKSHQEGMWKRQVQRAWGKTEHGESEEQQGGQCGCRGGCHLGRGGGDECERAARARPCKMLGATMESLDFFFFFFFKDLLID